MEKEIKQHLEYCGTCRYLKFKNSSKCEKCKDCNLWSGMREVKERIKEVSEKLVVEYIENKGW